MEVITRTTCRLCASDKLKDVLSLGNLYVSDFVEEQDESIKAPLELILCEGCGLLQLRHTAPQEIMYSRHYWYKSALNGAIVSDLKEIAGVAKEYMNEGDTILDIGANDGTLLSFVGKKYHKVGVEPANNLVEELRNHADETIHDFWDAEVYKSLGLPKAKVVTAIGMFYDMEDPGKFVKDVAEILDDEGTFITQLMTLKPMLDNNDVGNICHEHLEYYSYNALKYLFENNGLEIVYLEVNGINGGSYRIFARKLKTGSIFKFDELFDYEKFKKNIEENKKLTVDFIKKKVKRGQKVYGYGASTKGNTILQYYGLDNKLISGIADKNPDKFGLKTVGTNIPIINEDKITDADYYFILPWGFTKQFVENNPGKKFIVSIPKFKVYE